MEPIFRPSGALQFAAFAARDRVVRYREQAAQFRGLADAEPVGRLRAELARLAREYDSLADSMEAKTRDGSQNP